MSEQKEKQGERRSRKVRKVLLTIVVVGSLSGLAGLGTFSAFTATDANSANTITSGTVAVGQHSGATALYSLSNEGPGSTNAKCVRTTYSGTLAASLKIFVSSPTNGDKYNLKIERGSGITAPASDMNCTGFSASSTAFDAALNTFGTTYAAGTDGKAGGGAWAENDVVDYRFTITVIDDSTPNAHTTSNTTGSHTFTFEAQNN